MAAPSSTSCVAASSSQRDPPNPTKSHSAGGGSIGAGRVVVGHRILADTRQRRSAECREHPGKTQSGVGRRDAQPQIHLGLNTYAEVWVCGGQNFGFATRVAPGVRMRILGSGSNCG
ncbi:protein of unknown function [Methylorubrum extorquens]|uniref:Uncharacterized protein n=1 Tax=Methylorubrum extorquens TaxID=408 RepID=A0A2N9AWJ3_METEX|nr:protein of unknown function [Methylorubrum extorquens]